MDETRQDDPLLRGLRQFPSDVAHDLRGSLAGIGMLAMVARQHLALGDLDAARRDMQRISDQAQLSQVALDALWRLADRLERPLDLRVCDLDALAQAAADEAVLSVQAQLPGRRLPRLQLLPLGQARSDCGLVHVILVNLIGNALKHNLDHEEVCVSVRREAQPLPAASDGAAPPGRAAPAGSDGLVLVVSDDGAGFVAGPAARAPEPIPLPDAAGQVPGYGLGLSIVRRAVQRLGGHADVRSAPGQGTTVFVSIGVN